MKPVIQAKHTALEVKPDFRAQLQKERTLFNPDTFKRPYKLSQAYASVRNLEYRSDRDIVHQTFKDYMTRRDQQTAINTVINGKPRPRYPFDEAYLNLRTWFHHDKGRMLVLVDDGIYNQVARAIDQYVLDVGREGYWAEIYSVVCDNPVDIRAFLKSQRGIVGALLVGAVPAAWFEMDDDFHGHSEFPCDLYYMDTSGDWQDPDGDGMFSRHAGEVNPEIWIGRLYTPTANGNDAALINDYFARNHQFRLGRLGQARSAMAYVDDDWRHFDDCELDEMFPASVITKFTVPDVTDADLYKAEVNALRSWVVLCAHSSPHSHSLAVPSQNSSESIHYDYFRDVNPPNAHFYNLFCCGPGKFTTADYLGGWYIFDKNGGGTNNGLTAVASAKTGSMLYFADFYKPLGQGKVIGDAFVDWWKERGPDHDLAERCWFYGLTLLGDPTLTWWKGVVPQLQEPQDSDVFNHFPRKVKFRWRHVDVPGAIYKVEVDAFNGIWSAALGRCFICYNSVQGAALDHTFVGMQRGRWRVRAMIDGQQCAWSPWSYFEFTI